MREYQIEANLVSKLADTVSAICWKWNSTRRGVPDRITLLPVPPEHQEIVAKYVRFVETKATGEKPTAQQLHVHGLLRKQGYRVDVVDSSSAVDRLVEELAK